MAGLAGGEPGLEIAFVRQRRPIAFGAAPGVARDPAATRDVAQRAVERTWCRAPVHDSGRSSIHAWLTTMRCAELHDLDAEVALGALTGRGRAAAIAHLGECRACREDVRRLMVIGGQLLELLPPVDPPPGFETRVLERVGIPAPRSAT